MTDKLGLFDVIAMLIAINTMFFCINVDILHLIEVIELTHENTTARFYIN